MPNPMKSPGIRVNTVDDSQYTALPNTPSNAICIIGGACRGVIAQPVLLESSSDFLNKFGTPIDLAGLTAVQSLNGGGTVYYVRAAQGAKTLTIPVASATEGANAFTISATTPGTLFEGTWDIYLEITGTGNEGTANQNEFTLHLYRIAAGTTDSVDIIPTTTMSVDGSADNYYVTAISSATSELLQATPGATTVGTVAAVDVSTLTGVVSGTNGIIANDGADTTTQEAIQAAANSINDPESFEFMYIGSPQYSSNSVVASTLIDLAAVRDSSIIAIDCPGPLADTEAKDGLSVEATAAITFASSFTATSQVAFWAGKNLQVADIYNNGAATPAPPTVFMLPAIASLYTTRDAWVAPASLNNIKLNVMDGDSWSSADKDALYEANINPITNYRGMGWTAMGQKTAQLAKSALDRLNVRQLVNYVKSQLIYMSMGYLFAPIDQVTFDNWVYDATKLLNVIQTRRGIYGFKVQLDYTTTTPEYINNNTLHPIVAIKPTKTAEFIDIDLIIKNFSDSF